MNDEQELDAVLEAVTTAIRDVVNSLPPILKEEAKRKVEGVPLPVASGLRLAYALGRMTDDQRRALLAGAAMTEQEYGLLKDLLRAAAAEPQ